MGIIGWADTPNSFSEETAENQAAVITEELKRTSVANEYEATEIDVRTEPASTPTQAKPVETELGAVEMPMTSAAIPANELFDAIRNLNLKSGEDECDISKFELHEVKFLFNHAERQGFSDYYGVVREVFAVKHRILEKVDDIDNVESPNLDELLSFVEDKYEQSFRGEDS